MEKVKNSKQGLRTLNKEEREEVLKKRSGGSSSKETSSDGTLSEEIKKLQQKTGKRI